MHAECAGARARACRPRPPPAGGARQPTHLLLAKVELLGVEVHQLRLGRAHGLGARLGDAVKGHEALAGDVVHLRPAAQDRALAGVAGGRLALTGPGRQAGCRPCVRTHAAGGNGDARSRST